LPARCGAHESALTVAGTHGGTVETDPDWMEFGNGALAGLPFDVAAERFPVPAWRNPYESFHGTGESDIDIQIRATRALQNLVRRGPGRYLVVAHGGILNAALRVLVGAPTTLDGKHGIGFAFGDAGYSRLNYYPTNIIGRWANLCRTCRRISSMNSKDVVLHPEYPAKVWIVIEQPRGEPDARTFRRG